MLPVNRIAIKKERPVKILQYGEGNFLRAFVGHMVDIANEKGIFDGNIEIVKPISLGSIDSLREQDCIYTVLLRGMKDGEEYQEKRIITCVADATDACGEYDSYAKQAENPELRIIISNTTEAGIVYDETDDIALNPPRSYPGKLTKLLYERFLAFGGAEDKGVIILPVELIEKNGAKLKECCLKLTGLWKLPDSFREWLISANIFCNTLVDRIVTGYPANEADRLESEFGYTDKLIVAGEPFALWVIESESPQVVSSEFPLDKAGLPVIFTKELSPYRERKVRILNGGHTASVLVAYLAGLDTVGEMMKDSLLRAFVERAIYSELSPNVPLPAEEVRRFADSVIERFQNPFIRHNLLSISLNSVSKFKARVLPTILECKAESGELPKVLCFSLAALMAFYSGDAAASGDRLTALRAADSYDIIDDKPVLDFFAANHRLPSGEFTEALLARADFWGQNLTLISGLSKAVAEALEDIRKLGVRPAVEKLLK